MLIFKVFTKIFYYKILRYPEHVYEDKKLIWHASPLNFTTVIILIPVVQHYVLLLYSSGEWPQGFYLSAQQPDLAHMRLEAAAA